MTDRFDQAQLAHYLHTHALPPEGHGDGHALLPPFTVHVHRVTDSTNRLVWEAIAQGAPVGTVAIALHQSAGRGQWGRAWQSEPGGLYFSVALKPDISPEQGGQLTICCAWGIAAALRDRQIPVALKWPNDLVYNQRKVGGILTETRIHQGRIGWAVVGVGLNWDNSPPVPGISLKSILKDNNLPCINSLEQLAAIALNGLRHGYCLWKTQGIETLLPYYHQLLTHIGQPVHYQNQTARVAGVTPSGDLQLCTDSTPSVITLKPGTLSLGYESLQEPIAAKIRPTEGHS